MFYNLHHCKHKFTASHIYCHAFRVSSLKVIYVISKTIFTGTRIKLCHLFIASTIYFKNWDCPSAVLFYVALLYYFGNHRKLSINTADGSCMLRIEGINYNKSRKIKNTFLIADFIYFLTKSVLSVCN